MKHTLIYGVWCAMLSRCRNPHNPSFERYGARGVSVCERWLRFENFYADMGPRPAGLSIERKDNKGKYEPSNCVWATPTEQALNRRSNVMVTLGEKTQTASQWAHELGVGQKTIQQRLRRGWSAEKALTKNYAS